MNQKTNLDALTSSASTRLLGLRQLADALSNNINTVLDDIEAQANSQSRVALDDYEALQNLFTAKRKAQKISLEDLSLQPEISVSTLKRLLLNPENARVGHLMSVCKELGISVWLDK